MRTPLVTKKQAFWVYEQWKPYFAVVLPIVLLTVANAAVLVVYPLLLKRIIDGITQSLSREYLIENILYLVGFGITHFLIYASMQYLRARQNVRFEFSIRTRVFGHILELGQSFFSRFRTGDLVTRLMDDVNEKLSWFMCSAIFRLLEALLLILFGIIMMLTINPELTLYTAGPLPILVALFVFTGEKLHQKYARVQESISELNDSLESCFSGIRVVKAFTAEESQRKLLEQKIDEQRLAEIRAVRWQTIIDSFYSNIWQLAIIGVLLAGGAMAIQKQITIGDIVAFETYVMMLVWPMFDVGQFLVRGRLSAVSIDRLMELEDTPPEITRVPPHQLALRHTSDPLPEDVKLVTPERTALTVEFDRVSYQYPTAKEASLSNVSFIAKPGQLTAIAGEVGCGKSTCLLPIPRLIDPNSGRMLIGERSTADWEIVDLRQRIGYVPQEAQLLSGTILENIRFGRDWLTDEDIELAIEMAQLREDLKFWPEGLDTIAGSRGVKLSGGQKQRVSLARALAGKPAVLLLDDCTASLDARTEERVWEQLLHHIPHCTTILVTHRPATLERSDQIVVLDQGTVRETGTFRELNNTRSLFHQLYVRWSLEESLE